MIKHTPLYDHCSWLESVIQPHRVSFTVRRTLRAISGKHFDAIAFRGMSGALIAPIIAYKKKKNLLLVRKPRDGGHSGRMVEGDRRSRRYIIIDDFISGGETVRTIVKRVKQFAPQAKCVGVYLYNRDRAGLQRLVDIPVVRESVL